MKKFLCVLLTFSAVAALFCSCAGGTDWEYIKNKDEFVIGYTLYEPMNFKDENGSLTGFDTDFANAVCSELGLKPKFVEINWETKTVELNSKNIDCIWNGFTVNEERKEEVDFSVPYISNKQVVIIKKSNADKYKTIENLKGASCTAEAESAGETAIKSEELLKDNKYVASSVQTKVLLEVKSGTSDFGVIDYIMARSMIADDTDYSDLMMVEDIELTPEEYAIGFRKNSPETLNKINDAIQKLADNGKLKEIADKYNLYDRLTQSLQK